MRVAKENNHTDSGVGLKSLLVLREPIGILFIIVGVFGFFNILSTGVGYQLSCTTIGNFIFKFLLIYIGIRFGGFSLGTFEKHKNKLDIIAMALIVAALILVNSDSGTCHGTKINEMTNITDVRSRDTLDMLRRLGYIW